MPMWRKSAHDSVGYFNEDLQFAGDWEMWLRFVEKGLSFKKVYNTVGLYYFNHDGLSTSIKNSQKRFLEEKQIFNNFKHVFGKEVYQQFKRYFNGE